MSRLKPIHYIIGTIVLIPLLAIAWWLGSPLFLNQAVEEDFPFSQTATIPDSLTQQEAEQIMSGIAKIDMKAEDEMMTAMEAARVLKSGNLADADAFHKGSGQITIYALPEDLNVLRFENLNVTNGPDLHVLLSAHPNPSSQAELKDSGYIDLGPLKGNQGNQNYEIPAEVDISEMQSVVIYCMPFHVLFSIGELSDSDS